MKREHTKEESAGRPFVVAVSGTSGGGKTTLVLKVAALLGGAARLHFDDYVSVNNDPAAIRAWLEGGANPDEFKTPQLPTDLRRLISGESVLLPNDRGAVESAEFILIEEPFGRSRAELSPLVDFAAHLHVPADIALARRIVRTIEAQEERRESGELIEHIHRELKTYIAAGREAYDAAERAATRAADIVLDGLRPTEELAAELVSEIQRRRPPATS